MKPFLKPVQKSELVRVTYWACHDAGHRHKTEATAAKCISDMLRRASHKTVERKWDRKSYAAVLLQHREGATYAELGRQLGLSASRVAQVVAKAARLERGPNDYHPVFGYLSLRCTNLLHFSGLNDVDAIRKAFEDGSLRDIPNMGRAGISEIGEWLETIPVSKSLPG